MNINELTRLAFINAESEQRGYAQCWPEGSPERQKANDLANQFHRYRIKRWGSTELESVLSNATPTSISDVIKAAGG